MHCRCDFFRSWPLALILASAALTARATQLASALSAQYRNQVLARPAWGAARLDFAIRPDPRPPSCATCRI